VSHQEFVVSNDLLDRPGELRARVEQDGYLFFRGLLPRADVLGVRRAILAICRAAGWLVTGSDLLDGRADTARSTVEPEPAYMQVYNQVLRLEAFNALAHHPALVGVVSMLVGEPAFPHPLKIARLMFPQNVRHTTPPHQDFVFIQGTPETFTCWLPLGDCPRELGGLTVNAGTHRAGLAYDYHLKRGAGGMGIDQDTLPDTWHTTDYQAGDVLLFHSFLVHQALPNRSPDRLRLSVDYRYQGQSQPISALSLQPHFGQVTWEEVYRDWQATDLQYYWQPLNLTVVPLDPRWAQQREAEAFTLARQGEPLARPILVRIAERDPDPARRAQARQALAELERVRAARGPAAGEQA
jgi:ectoine hydroxylase-related dioxygenase (phytanoyl-CoA dioxygenase family)